MKQAFWTAFGQYMAPVLSAEGDKINWVNYKTKEKAIFFRMQADNRLASVAIELTHPDAEIQQIYFEQFQQLKSIFSATAGGHWHWRLHTHDEYGRTVSRIETQIDGVSIFRKEDWPHLIRFFKENIMALDEFWSQVKYGFESLR